MSTENTSKMRAVFTMAWQFVKRNGFTMSEALKAAWANVKLKIRMCKGIVKFHFRKVDGSIREAYGTLKTSLMPKNKPYRAQNIRNGTDLLRHGEMRLQVL